jgi:hypothetical protein
MHGRGCDREREHGGGGTGGRLSRRQRWHRHRQRRHRRQLARALVECPRLPRPLHEQQHRQQQLQLAYVPAEHQPQRRQLLHALLHRQQQLGCGPNEQPLCALQRRRQRQQLAREPAEHPQRLLLLLTLLHRLLRLQPECGHIELPDRLQLPRARQHWQQLRRLARGSIGPPRQLRLWRTRLHRRRPREHLRRECERGSDRVRGRECLRGGGDTCGRHWHRHCRRWRRRRRRWCCGSCYRCCDRSCRRRCWRCCSRS